MKQFSRNQPAACLRVWGPDAASFLQSQFTNDLRPFEVGRVTYGFWLDPKGHCLGDSFVLQIEEASFLLISYFVPGRQIAEMLDRRIIADEVEMAVVENAAIVTLVTDIDAPGELEGVPVPSSERYETDGFGLFTFRGRRHSGVSVELLSIDGNAADLPVFAHWEEIGADGLERLRIDAGIARVPEDIGSDDLPPEGGFDVGAISYSKGCYTGQEVMSRLKHVGSPTRSLYWLTTDNSELALPADLFRGEKRVGRWTTAYRDASGWRGLGLIRHKSLGAEVGLLSLSAEGTPEVALEPVKLSI